MVYLDAALDRVADRLEADHRLLVDAVRAGTIFANNPKAYQRWQRQTNSAPKSLAEPELERAIMNIARMFPGNVVYG